MAAAHALTAQGHALFSPIELIEQARRQGSKYPDTTLRTFIVGPMCKNSPNHHAIQYGDLVRVSHGLYRLAAEAPDNPPPAVPRAKRETHVPTKAAAPPGEAKGEWCSEGNVQAALVRRLAVDGWHIRRVASMATSEPGVDIEADRDGQRLLVEVEGYPSSFYARGERQGQAKPTSPPLQARANFSNALLTGLILRAEHPDAERVLAFPAFETYQTLARRTAMPLALAGTRIWIVDTDNGVIEEETVAPGPLLRQDTSARPRL